MEQKHLEQKHLEQIVARNTCEESAQELLGCSFEEFINVITIPNKGIELLRKFLMIMVGIRDDKLHLSSSYYAMLTMVFYFNFFLTIYRLSNKETNQQKKALLVTICQLFTDNISNLLNLYHMGLFHKDPYLKPELLAQYSSNISIGCVIAAANLEICNDAVDLKIALPLHFSAKNVLLLLNHFRFLWMLTKDMSHYDKVPVQSDTFNYVLGMTRYILYEDLFSEEEKRLYNFQCCLNLLESRVEIDEYQPQIEELIQRITNNDSNNLTESSPFYSAILLYIKDFGVLNPLYPIDTSKITRVDNYLAASENLLNRVRGVVKKQKKQVLLKDELLTVNETGLAFYALYAMRMTIKIMHEEMVVILKVMDKGQGKCLKNDENFDSWFNLLIKYRSIYDLFVAAKKEFLSLKIYIPIDFQPLENFWFYKMAKENFIRPFTLVSYLKTYAEAQKLVGEELVNDEIENKKTKQSSKVSKKVISIPELKGERPPVPIKQITEIPKEIPMPETPITKVKRLIASKNYFFAILECRLIIGKVSFDSFEKAEAYYYLAQCLINNQKVTKGKNNKADIRQEVNKCCQYLMELLETLEFNDQNVDSLTGYLEFIYQEMPEEMPFKAKEQAMSSLSDFFPSEVISELQQKERAALKLPSMVVVKQKAACANDKTFKKIVNLLTQVGRPFVGGSAVLIAAYRDFDFLIFNCSLDTVVKKLEQNSNELGIKELKIINKKVEHIYFEIDKKIFNVLNLSSSNFYDFEKVLAENAQNRLFTTHGVFYDPVKGVIYDSVGGVKDFNENRITLINSYFNKAFDPPSNFFRVMAGIIQLIQEKPQMKLIPAFAKIFKETPPPAMNILLNGTARDYLTRYFFQKTASIAFKVFLDNNKMDSIVLNHSKLPEEESALFLSISKYLGTDLERSFLEFEKTDDYLEMAQYTKYFFAFLLWPELQKKLKEQEILKEKKKKFQKPEECIDSVLKAQYEYFPAGLPKFFINKIKLLWSAELNPSKKVFPAFHEIIFNATKETAMKFPSPKTVGLQAFKFFPENNNNTNQGNTSSSKVMEMSNG